MRLGTVLAIALAGMVLPDPGGPPPVRFPLGASALDARATYLAAEARTYRLTEDGVTRFSCRVDCPYADRLAEHGGPLEGRPPRFTLWWRAPDTTRVTLDGAEGLTADERQRLIELVEPLHELVLPLAPRRTLAAHDFRFVTDVAVAPGELLVEATAREPAEMRKRARFRIDGNGIVVEEILETAAGDVSDFRYRHATVAGRLVVTACEGTFRGAPVGIDLEWESTAAGRPVPTRVVVHQYGESGAPLPGAMGQMSFRLMDHVVNGEQPEAIFADATAGTR